MDPVEPCRLIALLVGSCDVDGSGAVVIWLLLAKGLVVLVIGASQTAL